MGAVTILPWLYSSLGFLITLWVTPPIFTLSQLRPHS